MTEKVNHLDELVKGEKILFNDRKTPLKIEKVEDNRVLVSGPQGGDYEIYSAEDTDDLLVSKKDNRRYASYCKNLRRVGEWVRKEDTWTHSITGSEVKLEKNEIGYWQMFTSLETSFLDLPKYGYSEKDVAIDDAEKLVSKNPEG